MPPQSLPGASTPAPGIGAFKEEGLPFAEMQALFARMKACGKTTCLEVVAYTLSSECLAGPKWPLPAGVIS